MDAAKAQSMGKFSGVNNVDDPTNAGPDVVGHDYVFPLQEANNIIIDNAFGMASRGGFTTVVDGTDVHSLWSDGKTSLFVDGSILYNLLVGYGTVAVRTGLTAGHRMSYAPFNDRIYYSNGHEIGFVKSGADNRLPDPGTNFKQPLPAGQLIEVFRGCLYVASGKVLYISDPLCDYYDVRMGYKSFSDEITLLRADKKTYFCKGKSGEDFERDEVYPVGAMSFTDVRIPGSQMDDQIKGNVAIWTATNGICMGDNSGNVVNLTDQRYTFGERGRGAGFIRDSGNIRHYVNSLY
ncbi:hypothetical protein EHM76_00615 [bacterium]|nr:MAG: hypothetical protein EHM76_00615 [bacterium]